MIKKEISCVKKDSTGNITHVGGKDNSGFNWLDTVQEVIERIESGLYEYYVKYNNQEILIVVVDDPDGKYIRTSPDHSESNNLDNLKDCP